MDVRRGRVAHKAACGRMHTITGQYDSRLESLPRGEFNQADSTLSGDRDCLSVKPDWDLLSCLQEDSLKLCSKDNLGGHAQLLTQPTLVELEDLFAGRPAANARWLVHADVTNDCSETDVLKCDQSVRPQGQCGPSLSQCCGPLNDLHGDTDSIESNRGGEAGDPRSDNQDFRIVGTCHWISCTLLLTSHCP